MLAKYLKIICEQIAKLSLIIQDRPGSILCS